MAVMVFQIAGKLTANGMRHNEYVRVPGRGQANAKAAREARAICRAKRGDDFVIYGVRAFARENARYHTGWTCGGRWLA